ncbi:hypothetical protein GJ744_000974 [Endocarpon pusillum]|uniref:Yeast cell wall synthesis Kre9/Knh1-like N-terminal domain-containing protein n=1 Tax=Endocarpon pusillum TaxID=364733 RepID=A0A8H7AA96_9EURO|nr:hypothetical protein GJ744_000974 [Endocarpon pusillum]
MRPWVPIVLAFAALVAAQGGNNNAINNPASGIQAEAGQPLTLTWTNPSSGTVTIKIQTSGDIQPTDGIVVAENIPNTGSATFTVPADVPVGQVYVQIINDANPSDYNFSGGFQVQGATNTASLVASTATASASALSSSGTASSASASASASASSSESASSSASESSASTSASSASASASSSSHSASASASSSSSASSASSSSASSSASNNSTTSASSSATSTRATSSRTSGASTTSAQSTTAPTNAAVPVTAQAGLLVAAVAMFGAAALF